MIESGYRFEFVGIDTSKSDEYQLDTLVFQFESEKSHHQYVVRIERYVSGLHCVKFFDNSNDDGTGKFSNLSATYEPRKIFRTVVDIALDVFRHDRKASFMYVGAADNKDEGRQPTRRYRVYKLFISDYDLHEWVEPADFEEHSMYVLTNIEAMPDAQSRKEFLNRISEFAGIISR